MKHRAHSSRRYKGTRNTNQPERNSISAALRQARNLIQQRQFPSALELLNQLADSNPQPSRQSRILGLIGDLLFSQGKYSDAIQAYQGAITNLPSTDESE